MSDQYEATLKFGDTYFYKGQMFVRDVPVTVDAETKAGLAASAFLKEKVETRQGGIKRVETRQKPQFSFAAIGADGKPNKGGRPKKDNGGSGDGASE